MDADIKVTSSAQGVIPTHSAVAGDFTMLMNATLMNPQRIFLARFVEKKRRSSIGLIDSFLVVRNRQAHERPRKIS
jgi:hypothetical protein